MVGRPHAILRCDDCAHIKELLQQLITARRAEDAVRVIVHLDEISFMIKRILADESIVPGVLSLGSWHTGEETPNVWHAKHGSYELTQYEVISGGRRITGFRETEIKGAVAWAAHVPGTRSGGWSFSELWVDGQRIFRPSLPGHMANT